MPTLLHISDLHRSPDEPIDNDTLIASITADLDRFGLMNERPGALIVSGDLVHGVTTGTVDYATEMTAQYESAYDFIARLCDIVLEGDRSKVVVVPGNHDICWNTSTKSMDIVPTEKYPKNVKQSLVGRDSNFRWSWKEQRLYKVARNQEYNDRLKSFWDAFENFYKDVDLPIPIDRSRGFHFYSLFDSTVLLVGFESTYRNDHLRYESELATGVIARCALEIRKLSKNPLFLGAVWHHSIHGPPSKEDYLNIEAVREMAGLGFQVGFHGHQHIAESTNLSVSINGGSTMCVVSAGSLCAGWRDLPRGIDRQYNIVHLDESLGHGVLHIREMVEGNQFTERRRGRFLDGKVPLSWSPRIDHSVDTGKRIRELTIKMEEALILSGTKVETKSMLELNPAAGSYPRKVLLKALQKNGDFKNILRFFSPPTDVTEIIAVGEAAFQLEDIIILKEIIGNNALPADAREAFEVRYRLLQIKQV